jgi:choline dehydrogenase-like flavoprotein
MRLTSPDPDVPPQLSSHYLTSDVDRRRMRAAVRLAAALLASAPFRRLGASAPAEVDLGTDRALDAWVAQNLSTSVHLSGTCRMGPDRDAGAVVDELCRVRGIEGLRVVDTSIMPTVTTRGPYATAIMIGERASDLFAAP